MPKQVEPQEKPSKGQRREKFNIRIISQAMQSYSPNMLNSEVTIKSWLCDEQPMGLKPYL